MQNNSRMLKLVGDQRSRSIALLRMIHKRQNDQATTVGISGQDVSDLINELTSSDAGTSRLSIGQIRQLKSTFEIESSQARSTIRALVESELTKMFDGIDPTVSKDDFIKRLNTLFTFKTKVKLGSQERISPKQLRDDDMISKLGKRQVNRFLSEIIDDTTNPLFVTINGQKISVLELMGISESRLHLTATIDQMPETIYNALIDYSEEGEQFLTRSSLQKHLKLSEKVKAVQTDILGTHTAIPKYAMNESDNVGFLDSRLIYPDRVYVPTEKAPRIKISVELIGEKRTAELPLNAEMMDDLIALATADPDEVDQVREVISQRLISGSRLKDTPLKPALGDPEKARQISETYLRILSRQKEKAQAYHVLRRLQDKLGVDLIPTPPAAVSSAAVSPAASIDPAAPGVVTDPDAAAAVVAAAEDASGGVVSAVDDVDDPATAINKLLNSIMGLEEAKAVQETITASAESVLSEAVSIDAPRFKPIFDGGVGSGFKKMLGKPTFGKFVLGALAVAAGTIAINKMKNKEVTQESVSGPPLLPGGNPYEKLLTSSGGLPAPPMAGSSGGTSFNVSVNGSNDEVREFMQKTAQMSNGKMQSTIRNRLPNPGKDPYDDIAGSF